MQRLLNTSRFTKIYLFFQPLTTELGQKTTRCESLRVLLPYVEWDRFVNQSGDSVEQDINLVWSYLEKISCF